MSSALEAIFLQESETETKKGILDTLHEDHPLNLLAHKVDARAHDDLTERMRLRKVKTSLEDSGIKVSGAEPALSCGDYQVSLNGHFNQHGNLKGQLTIVIDPDGNGGKETHEGLLQATQMVLHSWGFACVVDRKSNLKVYKDGISEERIPWIELGLGMHGVEGMTWQQAEEWIMADDVFADVRTLEGWADSGISLAVAKQWASFEGTDYRGETCRPWATSHMAREWMDAGYDVERASYWGSLSTSMQSYRHAKSWIDAGLTPGETKRWLALLKDSAYHNNYGAVQPLRDAGFTPEQAMELGDIGVNARSLISLQEWATEVGMRKAELMEWCRNLKDIKDIRNISSWRYHGFTPEQAAEWCRVGACWGRHNPFDQTALAKEWCDQGLGPEDAKPWVGLHREFAYYDKVALWKEIGCTPSDAKPWAEIARKGGYTANDLIYPSRVMEWQEIHPRLVDPRNVAKLVYAGISQNQAIGVVQAFDLK